MMMMNEATEAELLLNYSDMSVLERQRLHLKHTYCFDPTLTTGFFSDVGFLDTDLPVTTTTETDARRLSLSPEETITIGSENIKKRKFIDTETKNCNEKKKMMMNIEVEEEEEKSKITEHSNEMSNKSNMKMKNKSKKVQNISSNDSSNKSDYIHVRARRGQATDSHSIAERARREKISERMKYLQDLVPGCNKIIGKAGMLDEIINYVQSLQRQVEFLSMKLAAVNPRLDFDIDDILAKEVVSAPVMNLPNTMMPMASNEMVNSGYSNEMVNSGYLHFNPMQQVVTSSDPLLSFNNVQAPSMWDSDVKNLYSSLGV